MQMVGRVGQWRKRQPLGVPSVRKRGADIQTEYQLNETDYNHEKDDDSNNVHSKALVGKSMRVKRW